MARRWVQFCSATCSACDLRRRRLFGTPPLACLFGPVAGDRRAHVAMEPLGPRSHGAQGLTRGVQAGWLTLPAIQQLAGAWNSGRRHGGPVDAALRGWRELCGQGRLWAAILIGRAPLPAGCGDTSFWGLPGAPLAECATERGGRARGHPYPLAPDISGDPAPSPPRQAQFGTRGGLARLARGRLLRQRRGVGLAPRSAPHLCGMRPSSRLTGLSTLGMPLL